MLAGDHLAQQGDEHIGANQDEGDGQAHAQAVEQSGGNGHGGAHTQKLGKHWVLGKQALFQLSFEIHCKLPPSQRRSAGQGGVHALGHCPGGHGGSCERIDGAAVLADGQLVPLLPTNWLAEAPSGDIVRGGIGAQAGGLRHA